MPKEYVTMYIYEGLEIQTLRVAVPSKGDTLGYIIDHWFFMDRTYDLVQDAIDDIDRNKKFIYDFPSK